VSEEELDLFQFSARRVTQPPALIAAREMQHEPGEPNHFRPSGRPPGNWVSAKGGYNRSMAFEHKLRATIAQHVSVMETVLYVAVGILLIVAAILGVLQAGAGLWRGITGGTTGNSGLLALDQLLLVLMLVEILHTVRISIRTHTLTMVPFLIVGLIASIRRVLVITVHAARLAEQGHTMTSDQVIWFRESMIELGVLAVLILVFVLSIARLRSVPPPEDASTQ